MLDREEVSIAVELQRKTYGLLQWISEAVRKGALTFSRAHEYATVAESFRDWLVTYTRQVPGKWRPRMSDAREVDMFANLFASYLLTSFELVEEPGFRMAASDWGCSCILCRHLVAAPHLRARRISDHEKNRAQALKVDYVMRLAAEVGGEISDSKARALVDASETAEPVALATYGEALVARCHGSAGEPALLALWREFAWTRAGSPRRDFELAAAKILDAEAVTARALAA